MVESLGCAATWLVRGDCLVCYGDIVVTHSDARALASTPGDIVVAYDPAWETMWARRFDDPLGDAESFRLAPDGRLAEIGRPLQSLGDAQGQYLGLLRFTPHGWRELAQVIEDERPQHLTEALNGVVSAGRMPVWTAPVHGPWWEFDTPRDLALGDPVVRAIDASEAATPQAGGSR
jgi:choline kinase